MKWTFPLFLSRGWGEFECEGDKLGKREKGKYREWGNKKVFNTSIKRFWGFIKLGRWKFEIRKVGREILSKDFRGRSFTKFLVLQKTSNYTSKGKKFHLVVQHINTNFTSQRSHTIKTSKLKAKGLQPTSHQN
ncbi:hypothetical protein YC2023_024553 [Brassica napus]